MPPQIKIRPSPGVPSSRARPARPLDLHTARLKRARTARDAGQTFTNRSRHHRRPDLDRKYPRPRRSRGPVRIRDRCRFHLRSRRRWQSGRRRPSNSGRTRIPVLAAPPVAAVAAAQVVMVAEKAVAALSCTQMMLSRSVPVARSATQRSRSTPPTRTQPRQPARQRLPMLVSSHPAHRGRPSIHHREDAITPKRHSPNKPG
jgi:hypothetical protein